MQRRSPSKPQLRDVRAAVPRAKTDSEASYGNPGTGVIGTLEDFARFGVRHDLHPTCGPSGEPSGGWGRYLQSINDYVRQRAAAALVDRDHALADAEQALEYGRQEVELFATEGFFWHSDLDVVTIRRDAWNRLLAAFGVTNPLEAAA